MGRPLRPPSADGVSHVLNRTKVRGEQWFLTPFSVAGTDRLRIAACRLAEMDRFSSLVLPAWGLKQTP